MSQKNRGWLATALVLIVGLAVAAFLFQGKPQPELQPVRSAPAPVAEFISRSPARMALVVTTQGTVQPRRQIDLVAQVGGEVEGTAEGFAEGDFFAAGEVLVQLEQQDYRFAIERARARVADARQLLAIEKGRTRQAKREWRDLGDRDANDLFLRVPQLASAEAALRAAKADLGQAELELKRTAVTAPFDGRIRQTMVDVGQFVVPGAAVARIYSTEAVEVRLPLTDRQVGLLDLSLASGTRRRRRSRYQCLSAAGLGVGSGSGKAAFRVPTQRLIPAAGRCTPLPRSRIPSSQTQKVAGRHY